MTEKTPKVDIAVFPVAGLGTRFLPITKALPKEMLPIVDKPLIQFAVEEAIDAGIKKLVFISGKGKRSIEDHFDEVYKLRAILEEKGDPKLLDYLNTIPEDVTCIYIRQGNSMGLGAAVLRARAVVEGRPFALLLPDDFVSGANLSAANKSNDKNGRSHCLSQLINIWNAHHANALAVLPVTDKEVSSYGIVSGEPQKDGGIDNLVNVADIVEKPAPEEVSSRLGIMGRYVFGPEIFDYLERTPLGVGNELQLTDAIKLMLGKEKVLAYEHQGLRYDCGSKAGYLYAMCDYALSHDALKSDFVDYMKKRLKEHK